MGCASSKDFQMQAQKHGWTAPSRNLQRFARSVSMPLRSSKSKDRSSFHVVALTSSTYGALKMEKVENASAEDKGARFQQENVYSTSVKSNYTQPTTEIKLTSTAEALELSDVTDVNHVIDVWELVHDLEEDELSCLTDCPKKKKVKIYGRSSSACQGQMPRKLDAMVYEPISSARISSRATDTKRAISSGNFTTTDSQTSCFSNSKSIKGLFYGESLFSINELERKASILEEELFKDAAISASPTEPSNSCLHGYTTPSSLVGNDSESLRLNLETLNPEETILCHPTDDDWCYIASDGEVEESSEAESPSMMKCLFLHSEDEEFSGSRESHKKNKSRTAIEPTNKSHSTENSSFSKVFALEVEEKKLYLCQLEKFEMRCPPGGEDRIVLYVTSLRGIRKTYEDCSNVKKILQVACVKVDERDVSMHSGFLNELKGLLEKPLPVPKLFIKGRYIGGAEEVMQLNEAGELTKLLEIFPRSTSCTDCEGCGGMRFIPCPKCSGSCKIFSEIDEIVRCPCCNENGLLRCPICM